VREPGKAHDKMQRVRPVIDMLNYTFGQALCVGGKLSMDEATIAGTSPYLPGKMYNPMKPHKYGLKVSTFS
jgi:hypothetical protein